MNDVMVGAGADAGAVTVCGRVNVAGDVPLAPVHVSRACRIPVVVSAEDRVPLVPEDHHVHDTPLFKLYSSVQAVTAELVVQETLNCCPDTVVFAVVPSANFCVNDVMRGMAVDADAATPIVTLLVVAALPAFVQLSVYVVLPVIGAVPQFVISFQ